MAKFIDNNLFRVRDTQANYKCRANTKLRYKIELVGLPSYNVKEKYIYFEKKDAFKRFKELSKNLPSHMYAIFTYHYCKMDLIGKWIASSDRSTGIVWSSELGNHINRVKGLWW